MNCLLCGEGIHNAYDPYQVLENLGAVHLDCYRVVKVHYRWELVVQQQMSRVMNPEERDSCNAWARIYGEVKEQIKSASSEEQWGKHPDHAKEVDRINNEMSGGSRRVPKDAAPLHTGRCDCYRPGPYGHMGGVVCTACGGTLDHVYRMHGNGYLVLRSSVEQEQKQPDPPTETCSVCNAPNSRHKFHAKDMTYQLCDTCMAIVTGLPYSGEDITRCDCGRCARLRELQAEWRGQPAVQVSSGAFVDVVNACRQQPDPPKEFALPPNDRQKAWMEETGTGADSCNTEKADTMLVDRTGWLPPPENRDPEPTNVQRMKITGYCSCKEPKKFVSVRGHIRVEWCQRCQRDLDPSTQTPLPTDTKPNKVWCKCEDLNTVYHDTSGVRCEICDGYVEEYRLAKVATKQEVANIIDAATTPITWDVEKSKEISKAMNEPKKIKFKEFL